MERYVETFFRFKWLMLVVLLLLPITGACYAVRTTVPLYQATATVWAEKPAYLTAIADWNTFQTPAQNQAGNVMEMLQSRKFDEEVIQQTDLKGLVHNDTDLRRVIARLNQGTTVSPVGAHLIAIRYTDTRPSLTVQVVNAIIASFGKELLANASGQGALAVSFYQQQLDDANAKLAKSDAALSSYLQANPDLARLANDTTTRLDDPVFTLQHPELAKFMQQRNADATNQQRLQQELEQVSFSQSSGSIVQEQTFRVVDPATAPNQPMSSRKRMLTPVSLSLVAALAFVIGGVLLLTALDTTLRSERLAAARHKLPVMTAVPLMGGRRQSAHQAGGSVVRSLLALQARTPEAHDATI